jgi:hypothetical protein
MSVDAVDVLSEELATLNLNDASAVRSLAQKLEALGDLETVSNLCSRSNALKRAVGLLRTEALGELLTRDARDDFIALTANKAYMALVDLRSLRVPRYVSVETFNCTCDSTLMVPYPRLGGPSFPFDCPTCQIAYIAKVVYAGTEYRVAIEQDHRPAKKRKKRQPVL